MTEIKKVNANAYRNTNLSAYSARWGDEEGLFQVVEGTGWNTGDRADLIAKQYYMTYRDYRGKISHITLHPGTAYTVIVSASRMPRVGDAVEVAELTEHRGEKLIVYTPKGAMQPWPLPNNFTILKQSETGMLMDTIGIKMPYLEHLMIQSLESRIEAEDMRVYSYTDAKNFLAQFPLLALIVGLLLADIILWGGTCRLTKRSARPGCYGAIWALWVFMLPLTKIVDLPASLMLHGSILDIGHYCREFPNIFTTMESLGDQSLQRFGLRMAVASAAIVLALAALSVALFLFERKRCNRISGDTM